MNFSRNRSGGRHPLTYRAARRNTWKRGKLPVGTFRSIGSIRRERARLLFERLRNSAPDPLTNL